MENGMMNGEDLDDRSGSPGLTRSSSRNSMNGRDGRTSLLRRNQSLSAKQITFYRNGDRFYCGLKLAVSSERYKEFDSLLAELSQKLDLQNGAVRYIFCSETGKEVRDVGELQYGVSYVCSSTNHFQRVEGGYKNNQPQWALCPTKGSQGKNELNNWKGQEGDQSNQRDFIRAKLVTVVKLGKKPQKKVTMLLNTKTASSLNQVLDHLSSKVTVGKVDRLYTVNGKQVKVLRDLFEDDTVFVAFSSTERPPEEGFDVDLQRPERPPWRFCALPMKIPYIPALRPATTQPYKEFTTHLHCILAALTTPTMSIMRPKSARASSVSPRFYTARSPKGPPARQAVSAPPSCARPKTAPSSGQRTPESTRKSLTPPRMNSKSSDGFKIQSNRPKAGSDKPIAIKPRPKPKAGSYKPVAIRPKSQATPEQKTGEDRDSDDEEAQARHGYYIYVHGEKVLCPNPHGEGKPTASVRPMVAEDLAGSDSDDSDIDNFLDNLDLKPLSLNVKRSESLEASM